MDEHAHAGRRGDTRARIQQVALKLFAEQGYERTSLREIAERLGVTKAALYYHFKSKEDIVRSFTEDYFARLDALIHDAHSASRRRMVRSEHCGVAIRSYPLPCTNAATTCSNTTRPGTRRRWQPSG